MTLSGTDINRRQPGRGGRTASYVQALSTIILQFCFFGLIEDWKTGDVDYYLVKMNSSGGLLINNNSVTVKKLLDSLDNFSTPNRLTPDITGNEDLTVSFVLCVIKCVWSLPIIIGNGLTLATVIRHVKKTPSHVSVGFLACADLLVGFTPWFFLTMYLNIDLLYDKVFCTFSAWFEAFLAALNPTAIFIIACERCILITNWQLHRKHLSVRRQISVSILGVIFASIIPTVSVLAGDVQPRYGNCYWALNTEKTIPNFILIPMYLVLLSILIICNSRVVYFVWKQKIKLISHQSAMNQKDFGQEKKTTALQAFIVTYCIIFTLPLLIYSSVIPDDPEIWRVELLNVLLFIWYLTALINPFIYAWRVPAIQEGYHKICCRLMRNRHTNKAVPFHGTRGLNGHLQPRAELGKVQNQLFENTVPETVKNGRTETHANKDTVVNKYCLKVTESNSKIILISEATESNKMFEENKAGDNVLAGNSIDNTPTNNDFNMQHAAEIFSIERDLSTCETDVLTIVELNRDSTGAADLRTSIVHGQSNC